MNRMKPLVLIPAIVAIATACSKPAPSNSTPPTAAASVAPGPIDVSLNEFSITISTHTVPAGKTVFAVKNIGTRAHEFVVLKTDTPAADFAVGSFEGQSDRIDEDAAGTNVGETGDLEPGTSKTVTITLEPGHYAVVCNLPGHYRMGMRQDVTVTP